MLLTNFGYRRKLDPKVKKEWLKALRSGEYKQATRAMTKNLESFCCLGVLCDVTVDGTWEKKDHKAWYLILEDGTKLKTSNLSLLSTVLENSFPDWDTALDLAQMNDFYKMSFEEIANWIEKNL